MTEDDEKANAPESDELGGSHTEPADNPGTEDTVAGWDEISTDPSPQDLGYEISQWERIPGSEEKEIILLPTNEAALHDQAFIILDEDSLCDLLRRR